MHHELTEMLNVLLINFLTHLDLIVQHDSEEEPAEEERQEQMEVLMILFRREKEEDECHLLKNLLEKQRNFTKLKS